MKYVCCHWAERSIFLLLSFLTFLVVTFLQEGIGIQILLSTPQEMRD
jgi:hypothetical protein